VEEESSNVAPRYVSTERCAKPVPQNPSKLKAVAFRHRAGRAAALEAGITGHVHLLTIAQLLDALYRILGAPYRSAEPAWDWRCSFMEVDSRQDGKETQSEFVNEGLLRWKEGRKKWLAARCAKRRPKPPRVDDEVILETIFAKPTGWLLPHPVPLPHMIELLEDEWSD